MPWHRPGAGPARGVARRSGGRAGTVVRSVVAGAAVATAVAGCGSSHLSLAAQAQQQAYLNDVHETAADVNTYRTDTELVRLGHAVCDDLKSGASYGTIADRLGTTTGASTLPSQDLGAVITSAATVFCPQYADKVS